jgi:NADH dehydrogenase/NADH:ubiquinone oxidoreductase subunit G
MKKSELKSYIKEMIISELGGAVNLGKNANPADIKKFTAQGIDVNLKENKDEEDEAKLEKKAQAAAKKGGGKVGKLQRVTAQLKELEKEMKELVGKWKKAEGKEKETLLDKLKEKTKVKKELEALEDKLADAIV